jgi:hypothetical protein
MNVEIKVTIIIAVITGIKWVYEYTKQRQWEKNKYLVDRLDLFKSKDYVKVMHKLLDWNKVTVEINNKEVKVNDDILYEAFTIHKIKPTFTLTESELRTIFDNYFDDLTELLVLSEIGLIDETKLEKYMKYWFDIIKGKTGKKELKLINQIHTYLEYYGYDDLYYFLNYKI